MSSLTSEPSTKPFQVALLCGTALTDAASIADTAIDLQPPSLAQAVESFKRASLKTTDMRAKSVFMVGGSPVVGLAMYSLLLGFAGRYIDIATPSGVVTQSVRLQGVHTEDIGKAPDRADCFTLAASASLLGDEPGYIFSNGGLSHLSPAEVSQLRSARRIRFAPSADDSAFSVFVQFMFTAGLRARKGFERLPVLVWEGVEVDLDDLRRAGADFRKTQTSYKLALAPPFPPSHRQRRLVTASQFPIEQLLLALGCGSHTGDQRVLWQCPRPQSHTHGDATPSMQVSDNKVRCYVDDAEWIDPLRLTMEACGVTPDEAAGLLSSPPSAFEPFAVRIAAERARRAAPTETPPDAPTETPTTAVHTDTSTTVVPTEAPSDASTEAPTETPTTVVHTDTPTESLSPQTQADAPVEQADTPTPPDAPTDTPTDIPTDIPSAPLTQASTTPIAPTSASSNPPPAP